MKIQERERVCFELLKKLPQKFVLIGGYASSSYDFPRFSVDLDLVIGEGEVKEFTQILQAEGFRLMKESGHFADFYQGRIMRFGKEVGALPVSADLFVGMVQARQTGTAYSFDYLWKNSEIRRVVGTKGFAEARVADRDMLIALKMNSLRMADQRDIIALCNGKIDLPKVVSHLKRAPRQKILSNLDILAAILEKPGAKDSIKGVFGISDQVYTKLIEKARREISAIKKGLE